jgi:YebC/PmpR family DNA-binding regulatory protein
MSGHSKWSQIKHKKALTDAKRGKLFSKMARLITVAAREKGGDPASNPKLRVAIDKAHSFNMPHENIERAVKRGTGDLEGVKIEEFILEAYGPAGAALIIEGTTDNKNRTVSELKHLLSQHDGKLANPGSVLWLFERRGLINLKKTGSLKKDILELSAINAGAQDLRWLDEENLEIYTQPEELEKIKKLLEEKNIKIEEASLGWQPKNEITIDDPKTKERLEKLFETLDENDDVNEIYSNISQ